MLALLNRFFVFSAVLLLSACTIQLAPDYDEALVDRLDVANTQALTHFAAVQDGSPQEEFGQYENRYSMLIGEFAALKQRAETRQTPPLASKLTKIKFLSTFCNVKVDASSCVNASPASLQSVIDVMSRMRRTHKNIGLTADLVTGFETAYETAIKQALTVERALKR